MHSVIASFAGDSLDLAGTIGKEYYTLPYKITNGKILVLAGKVKDRTRVDPGQLFVVDMEHKKIIYTGEDPTKDYTGLDMTLIDDSTLCAVSALEPEDIYLVHMRMHRTEKRSIRFDATSNRPGIIESNGKQLFMIQNVYGFAVAGLNTAEAGKVFSSSSFSTLQSTVSYPVDRYLNLLSGTKREDGAKETAITLYAIEDNGACRWYKELPPVLYPDGYAGGVQLFRYKDAFIVRYGSTIESWDKNTGNMLWRYANDIPVETVLMSKDKLVLYGFANTSNEIPSDDAARNRAIRQSFREQFKAIDPGKGALLWSKAIQVTTTTFGLLGDRLLLCNDRELQVIAVDNGKVLLVKPGRQGNDLTHASLHPGIDTWTGRPYTEFGGKIYW